MRRRHGPGPPLPPPEPIYPTPGPPPPINPPALCDAFTSSLFDRVSQRSVTPGVSFSILTIMDNQPSKLAYCMMPCMRYHQSIQLIIMLYPSNRRYRLQQQRGGDRVLLETQQGGLSSVCEGQVIGSTRKYLSINVNNSLLSNATS